jgi:3-hydroxyacyl-CoA dehydrogenase
MEDGDIRVNTLRNRFLTIGQAKVATSAEEGFEYGYLRRGQDELVVSRDHHFLVAKKAVLELAEQGYVQPAERKDIRVLGNEGLGVV